VCLRELENILGALLVLEEVILMFIPKISVGSCVVWSDTMKTYFDTTGQRKEGRAGGV
jgi:hypothetical protein